MLTWPTEKQCLQWSVDSGIRNVGAELHGGWTWVSVWKNARKQFIERKLEKRSSTGISPLIIPVLFAVFRYLHYLETIRGPFGLVTRVYSYAKVHLHARIVSHAKYFYVSAFPAINYIWYFIYDFHFVRYTEHDCCSYVAPNGRVVAEGMFVNDSRYFFIIVLSRKFVELHVNCPLLFLLTKVGSDV